MELPKLARQARGCSMWFGNGRVIPSPEKCSVERVVGADNLHGRTDPLRGAGKRYDSRIQIDAPVMMLIAEYGLPTNALNRNPKAILFPGRSRSSGSSSIESIAFKRGLQGRVGNVGFGSKADLAGAGYRSRNSRSATWKRRGWSSMTMCPLSSMRTKLAPRAGA